MSSHEKDAAAGLYNLPFNNAWERISRKLNGERPTGSNADPLGDDQTGSRSPASAAAAIIEWDRRGRLVDDESYVQNNAPAVARAFWALREALQTARTHIIATPHGDNCFLDVTRPDIHRCWCGKDSAIDGIDDALAKAEGPDEVEEQVQAQRATTTSTKDTTR